MKILLTDNITQNTRSITGYNHIKIISSNGNSISLEEIDGNLIIRNN